MIAFLVTDLTKDRPAQVTLCVSLLAGPPIPTHEQRPFHQNHLSRRKHRTSTSRARPGPVSLRCSLEFDHVTPNDKLVTPQAPYTPAFCSRQPSFGAFRYKSTTQTLRGRRERVQASSPSRTRTHGSGLGRGRDWYFNVLRKIFARFVWPCVCRDAHV